MKLETTCTMNVNMLLMLICVCVGRLDDMMSVHRTHRLERADMESRLLTCESDIDKHSGSKGGLEDQYKFFQEMRGYVRDLVECLNEKVG